jgi:glycosyltransferase involved in cell wall biosynthesis
VGIESLSIVVPVFNEAAVIERVLRDIHAKIALRVADVEFIVAEDGSTDGTKEILARLEPELGLRLVSGTARKGYTGAVKDALRLPTREWVFFSDSDGQQEPDDFFEMAALADRSDLVVGFKSPRRDPLPRLWLSAGLRLATRLLLGARFRDVNCGFRLMRRPVVESILPHCALLPQFINAEFALRARHQGFRVNEVPVRHYSREDGGSRGLPVKKIPMEVRRLLAGLLELRREFRNEPVRGSVGAAEGRP